MYRLVGLRRAPRWGALFAFWALLSGSPTAQADECLPFHADEWAKVERVYDGDTVRLSDGRKVRFIGINTPEIGHDGQPSDPLAEEARQVLQSLLKKGDNAVALRFGQEKKDKYGRLLAHVYLNDHTNLQQVLLEQGLAFAVSIAPNVANLSCYRAAEERAAGKGIWAHKRFQVQDSRTLSRDARGFYRVKGRVERVGEGRKSIWLNLPNKVAVRIDKQDLVYFKNEVDPKGLQGRDIQVRGWLYEHRGELRMRVYHPFSLKVLK